VAMCFRSVLLKAPFQTGPWLISKLDLEGAFKWPWLISKLDLEGAFKWPNRESFRSVSEKLGRCRGPAGGGGGSRSPGLPVAFGQLACASAAFFWCFNSVFAQRQAGPVYVSRERRRAHD
jgi:hypothetical protein